ncbi:hypothetical protein [Acinetobacter baumannii]|uniref:hypothetical protein n=1 Tax=Acinetobacter baumannii TaxID=470 RepID=UPI00119D52E8|nr:hypothetical protein [Acinetobacter baumannii]MCP9172039.1 hypothetical protein [Acinetobacter baumannii]TWO57927.1 hypothetical protein FQK03_13375 [Acinetobacter baumannii]
MDRKQFEKWFKTTDAYKLLEEQNYFKVDLLTFKEHRNQYQHTSVQIAYMTWQHQQAKVEELKASHHGEVIGHEVHFKKIKQERDELQTLYAQQGINMLKLQKRVEALTQTMEEVLEEMKYPTATFEEVIVCGVKVLEQALKGEKE